MSTYYEMVERDGGAFATIVQRDTLEAAIEYAEAHGIRTIEECGGSWATLEKCWFCGEWFDICELDTENTCERCKAAIKSHGGV